MLRSRALSLFSSILTASAFAGCGSSGPTLSGRPPGPPSSTDVITYHYDNQRTGQDLNETALTPSNVNSTKFGKLGEFAVDGKVDAQPLYLSNVNTPSQGKKNVLYLATEHDSVYAFDADSAGASAPIWKVSLLATGESPSDDHGCFQVTPEIGVTSTPVIDRSRGAIYLIAVSKNSSGQYFQRIHALDLTTGQELLGGPKTITATYPGTGAGSSGGNTVFNPGQYLERPGLLEVNGIIVTTWGSHCDQTPYTSWVIAFNASTLAETSVLNLVPNGSDGGIWMSGAAPAADATGSIYFIIGNGTFDTALDGSGFPLNHDCGNCFVKVSSSAPLSLLDYFTPSSTVAQSNADTDFGSGGPLLLPDVKDASGATRHLAVGAGKDANIYLVDRDNMGKFNAAQNQIYQQISGQLAGAVFSKPSYFNGTVYFGAVGDALKAFPVTSAKLAATPSSRSTHVFSYPGASPTISANGATNGIVWAVENNGASLHAFDAANLGNVLYDSSTTGGRDSFAGNKFITPVVANGKVYVGTPNSVAVFGLLP